MIFFYLMIGLIIVTVCAVGYLVRKNSRFDDE